jgi:hypothetical protein
MSRAVEEVEEAQRDHEGRKVRLRLSRQPGATLKMPGVLSVTRSLWASSAGSAEASTVRVACGSVPVSRT